MVALAGFETLAQYNRWMNGRLFDVCAGIPDAERKRDRGAFFKSIHGTFNHLLLADRLWLGRFLNRPYSIEALDQELYSDYDELRAERRLTDEEILGFIAALDEQTLSGDIRFSSIVNPGEKVFPFRHVLLHFFNHQTHHRGQVTTLIKQAGYEPGVTDLMWLPAT